jgi:hypothetical protein
LTFFHFILYFEIANKAQNSILERAELQKIQYEATKLIDAHPLDSFGEAP